MILLFIGEKDVIVQEQISRMKDAGDGKTKVWVVGQSAMDGGFLIDMPFDELMGLITEEDGDEPEAENEEEEEELPAGEAAGRGDKGSKA